MIVLGIDPGTASTGYGVVKGDGLGLVSLVECGVIRTRAREPLATRLLEIYEGVTELIARHRPDALSVEDVFYAKNVRTTVVLGHARGVVLLAGEQAKIRIAELPPAEIKKAVVGTGVASGFAFVSGSAVGALGAALGGGLPATTTVNPLCSRIDFRKSALSLLTFFSTTAHFTPSSSSAV